MNSYISFFPRGLEKQIPEILKQDCEVSEILSLNQNFIIFTSEEPVSKIQLLNDFESTYLLIKFLGNQSRHKAHDLLEWTGRNIGKVGSKINSIEHFKGKSFRTVYASPRKSQLTDKFWTGIAQINSTLQNNFGIKINTAKPVFQLVLFEQDDFGFIGIKLSNDLQRKEKGPGIKAEIARFMIFLSEPAKDDIFIDPFCGSGAIPILRSSLFPYSKIIASDIDTSRVNENVKNVHEIEIIQSPVENLDIGGILPNKIVTDPPWGNIQKDANIENIYESLFKIPHAPESIFVVLTPLADLEKRFLAIDPSAKFSSEVFPLSVSGIDAHCYKIVTG